MSTKTPTKKKATTPYEITGSRSMVLDYTDQKMKLKHSFVKPDDRDIIQYYLNAPAIKANSKGELKMLGTPDAPAAELHDLTCNGLSRFKPDGGLERKYTLEEIRQMRQSVKTDGMLAYLGGYYDVTLASESGDLDDLLFGRDSNITATVKIRPDGRKVANTFKIFLSRADDLSLNRFVNHSQAQSVIDEKRDEILAEFIGDEQLSVMTGDEDEGNRVAFTKTTQYVRQFIDIVNKNFQGGENITFRGAAYDPKDRNEILSEMDPVLKIAIAAELRNFF